MVRSLVIAILLIGSVASAKKSWVCNHPDKPGAWGALSVGCDADQFGDVSRIKSIYPDYVYDRRFNDDAYQKHIRWYVTNINALIRKVAKDYYLTRIPDAKPATLEAWMQSAVAVGAHESQLSHYRISEDDRYKLMTGDHLISHGIMQVNQDYHANKDLDSSFDLVGNIIAGLDTYFEEWNNAVDQDCYKSFNGKSPSLETMLENRARSAYSAYNGGPGKLCRYTHKDKWSHNDDLFFDSIHNKPYMKFVTDPKQESPLNIKCIIAGDDLCAMAKPSRDKYLTSRPLVFADGKTCVTADGVNFTCANDMRVFSCLAKIDPEMLDNDPVKLESLPPGAKITTVTDREPLCVKAVQGLLKVGSTLIARKSVLIRDDIGGGSVGSTIVGRTYQVQDYDVRLGGKTQRYYKIKTSGGTEGWIYGGEDTDRADWAEEATAQEIVDSQKAAEQARAAREAKRSEAFAAGVAATLAATPEAKPTVKEEDDETATDDSAKDDDTAAALPVVGSIIEIVKEHGIALRANVGEDSSTPNMDMIRKGVRLTVEEIQTLGTENRIYLKVTMGSKSGWIYVGRTFPDTTVSQWIKIWK